MREDVVAVICAWLRAEPSVWDKGAWFFRKHGEPWFSGTLVIGDPQENEEKSRDCLICPGCFWVCQAGDYGKLSAPAFRFFLDRLRAPGNQIRQSSCHFYVFSVS